MIYAYTYKRIKVRIMTRWTLVVSDATDRALRTFLAQTGGKKGDLSDFVEKAVQDRLFHMTADKVKQRNSVYDQTELMSIIDEAVANVRADAPHS